MQLNLERLDFHPAMFENDYDVPLSYFVFFGRDFFWAVFINKLIIRLFDYSVFAASERTDSPGKGNAKILFNFEWP